MYKFFYKLNLLFKRIVGYEKPLRVALLGYLSLKFKTFKPHYESILYEACLEAKKLGINQVSVIELGVAGGAGIVSLEKYKKKIERVLDINIDIYGFDTGSGLPKIETDEDLSVTIELIGTDVDSDILTYHIVSETSLGTLVHNNNSVIFSPYENLYGLDNFSYVVDDGDLVSDTADVNIIILPVNDPPILSQILNSTINEGEVFEYILHVHIHYFLFP